MPVHRRGIWRVPGWYGVRSLLVDMAGVWIARCGGEYKGTGCEITDGEGWEIESYHRQQERPIRVARGIKPMMPGAGQFGSSHLRQSYGGRGIFDQLLMVKLFAI